MGGAALPVKNNYPKPCGVDDFKHSILIRTSERFHTSEVVFIGIPGTVTQFALLIILSGKIQYKSLVLLHLDSLDCCSSGELAPYHATDSHCAFVVSARAEAFRGLRFAGTRLFGLDHLFIFSQSTFV